MRRVGGSLQDPESGAYLLLRRIERTPHYQSGSCWLVVRRSEGWCGLVASCRLDAPRRSGQIDTTFDYMIDGWSTTG